MAVEIQGKVGTIFAADGSLVDPRLGRDGALVATDLHGRFYEQTSRLSAFMTSTASAGLAPGTALSAVPFLALVNPTGSGKYVSVNKAVFGWVSGTFGAGQLWWVQGTNPATLPAETTAAVRSSGLITGAPAGNPTGDVAKSYSGISLTNVPTILRPSSIAIDPYVGTAAPLTLHPPQVEEVNGSIVIGPGFWVALHEIGAAGTTPVAIAAIEYEIVSP